VEVKYKDKISLLMIILQYSE